MSKEPKVEKTPKRHKRKKRLLWFLFIFSALVYLINGPVARWSVRYGINSTLLEQGLKGDLSVHGTLFHGFTLSDISYRGDEGLQSIEATEVSADYRLLRELIHGKIRSISLTNATVIIDIDKFIPSEKSETKSFEEIKQTIELARNWIREPEINLNNIDITILKSEEFFARFELESLHHTKQSDSFTLTNFWAEDGQHIKTPTQDIQITWNQGKLSLDRIEAFPQIALGAVEIDWNSTLTAQATTQIFDAFFDLKIQDSVQIKLTKGILEPAKIKERFDIEIPVDFELSVLEVGIAQWKQEIHHWDVSATATLPTIQYDNYELADTQIELSQKNGSYSLSTSLSIQDAPIHLLISGEWTKPTDSAWWSHTKLNYEVSCEQLGKLPQLFMEIPDEVVFKESNISLKGSAVVEDLTPVFVQFELKTDGSKLSDITLPSIAAEGEYKHLQTAKINLSAKKDASHPINLKADYNIEKDLYNAEFQLIEDNPEWINQLFKNIGVNLSINSPLNITANSSGSSDIFADQVGLLFIKNLTIAIADQPDTTIDLELDFNFPESFEIQKLTLKQEDFNIQSEAHWDGEIIHLTKSDIFREDKKIAYATASIPYNLKINSLESFLSQKAQWKVDLDLQPLSIPQLRQWLPLDDIKQVRDLEGSVSFGVDLIGSPSAPELKGYLKLQDLRGIANKNLDALHMLGEFSTKNKRLNFEGELLEAANQRATLQLSIPFTPLKWVKNTEGIDAILAESDVTGDLTINTLPLNRIARIVPQLKEITGHLDGKAAISGKLLDPKIELDTNILIPKLEIAGDEVDDIRDIKVECKVTSDRQVTASLLATINGGKFQSNATADLTDLENPSFDLTLKTNHASVTRNDALSVRANADLRLSGTLEEATLSGSIGIVESLFYKDIDILPIGVPSSAVADVELPALDQSKIEIPVPEPFDKWKLDLNLKFEDPLLIRGNIARGQIEGGIKITGTAKDPQLDGKILAKKIVARLPFSELKINKGEIIFSPKNGLIPTLDIRGRSMVNNYDTSIYVYGSATSPKTTFTSYPPLAKNDIMTLLATGVTASGLSNNTGAATLRAAQLFLAKLKQESGDTRSTKIIEAVLDGVQEFEINVNEIDGFTGRQYSSAQVKLNKRFFVAAQIDENKQTRGLLIYVLRFR